MSLAVKTSRAQAQGDPGIFGAIGGALKGAIGGLTGGPLGILGGAISGGVRGARGGGGGGLTPNMQAALARARQGKPLSPQARNALQGRGIAIPTPVLPGIGRGFGPQAAPVRPVPGLKGGLQRLIPGGATGFEVQMMQNGAGGSVPGFHLNKSDYFLRSGEFVPAGTRLVRNRRRNPGNARANSRAIARIKSAKRMAKSLSHITVREKKSCR